MKFVKLSCFLAVLFAVTLPAIAQSRQFDIPFNFYVSGKLMPAGHYRVSTASTMDSSPWSISGTGSSLFMLTQSLESPSKVHPLSLVFWHSGGTYSLVEFWPADHNGRSLLIKPEVKSTILAGNGRYVELGAE